MGQDGAGAYSDSRRAELGADAWVELVVVGLLAPEVEATTRYATWFTFKYPWIVWMQASVF